MNKIRNIPKDIVFLMSESALTSFILFMPVAYLLFSDIGLDQFQIGQLQAVYMVTLLIMEIPTGYLADRLSLKWSNAFGDILITGGVLLYFVLNSFWIAIVAEVLFGLGRSMTNGADSALLRGHAEKAKLSYEKLAARLQSINFTMNALGAIVGAWIGSQNIRWPFLVQGVIFLVAALIAMKIKNAGKKRKSNVNPFRDMATVVKYCVHGHPKLFGRILFGSMLMTSTYLIVWYVTPVLLQAGISVPWHGFMFASLAIASTLGSEFVFKNGSKIKMATPLILTFVSFAVLGLYVGLLTVPFIALIGFARGMNEARIKPYIQKLTPDDMQATAISVYGVTYRIAAGGLGLLVNFAGNVRIQTGLLTAAVISIAAWVIFRYSSLKQSV